LTLGYEVPSIISPTPIICKVSGFCAVAIKKTKQENIPTKIILDITRIERSLPQK
jgi:hypothetical protein